MKRKTVNNTAASVDAVAVTAPEAVLALRTCSSDLTSYGGFQWPASGPVVTPDWSPQPVCGFGLHGLLWGEGDGSLLDWSDVAKWLVVEVEKATIVNLDGKVKFPKGNVIFCGKKEDAVKYIQEHGAEGRVVVAGTATAGYAGTATAGDAGTATAGDAGTATAGYAGTATAGDAGTATAGNRGTATAGYAGTATAGDAGTATAGNRGTATAGDAGTATAGVAGTATAGVAGTATAGYAGTVQLKYWDEKAQRYRIKTGYIGEDGLKPRTKYRLDGKFNFLAEE